MRGKADPTANATGPPEITGGGYGLALSRLRINRGISLSILGATSAFRKPTTSPNASAHDPSHRPGVCLPLHLSPRKLHPVFHLKGGICVQKKDAQFPRVST